MLKLKNTRAVIEHTKHFVKGETLDFGAGTAKYQHLIRAHASKYTTFDMMPGKNIDVVGDALNPPFEDASFDTVICTQVLEHVERPWIVAGQIARILRIGGVAIITAPFIIPYHADPHDYFRYTENGLESLFKNEGLETLESGTYGRLFSVFSEMIHFSLFNPYEKKAGKWSQRAMRYIERTASALDKLVRNKIIYANVYIVMGKK